MRRYDAILFDFDGVLVDSEPIHYRCWRDILQRFGIALEWDTYVTSCVGIADRMMLERLCGLAEPPVALDQLLATYPEKKQRLREELVQAMPFAEGIYEFIRSLADYKLAVVSSSGRLEVEPVLERAGLLTYFGALVCGYEAERLKPAPDPYLKAAELLGVSRALVVEDSDVGEASGRAAGFDVLRVSGIGDVIEAVRRRLGS
jgi:HAD superfamily hydrolase (TIGR01509 family)